MVFCYIRKSTYKDVTYKVIHLKEHQKGPFFLHTIKAATCSNHFGYIFDLKLLPFVGKQKKTLWF